MIDGTRTTHLGEFLRDVAVQFKENIALIEANRKNESARLSYLEWFRQAQNYCKHLRTVGVAPGDRVAVILPNQSAYPIAAAGAFFAGAVVVPIDYKLTASEQAALLGHAKPKALVIEGGLWRALSALSSFDPAFLSTCLVDAKNAEHTRFEEVASDDTISFDEAFVAERSRDDIATIVYSSGTGGRPKGCMLTHENYLSQYESLMSLYPIEETDRYFSILPTNHAIDFMCGFIGSFGCGATVVHQKALRPEFIRWTMKEYKITHMAVVPLLLEAFEKNIREQLEEVSETKRTLFEGLRLLNAAVTKDSAKPWLSRRLLKPIHDGFGGHLKLLFCGGAFTDRKRAEFFYTLGIPVVIGYGLTEACTVAAVQDMQPFRADSVGPAAPGVELKIDSPNREGVGEVWIKGPTVMKGYLDDPTLTAESFEGEWLKTGDLGRLDASGHLHLVGRSKNMIVTAGGKNVYPEDVENNFESLPCDGFAVYASQYLWSNGDLQRDRLIGVAQGGDTQVLLNAIRQRNHKLPEHKRIWGVLSWDQAFPRTASMKIKRTELAEALRNSASEQAIVPVSKTP